MRIIYIGIFFYSKNTTNLNHIKDTCIIDKFVLLVSVFLDQLCQLRAINAIGQ